jgi:hypothetical protein
VLEKYPENKNFVIWHTTDHPSSATTASQFSRVKTLNTQQGDLLGVSLFCATIHSLLTSLTSILRLGYMNDVTVNGPEAQVANDIEKLKQFAAKVARSGFISTTRSVSSFANVGFRVIQFSSPSFTWKRLMPLF